MGWEEVEAFRQGILQVSATSPLFFKGEAKGRLQYRYVGTRIKTSTPESGLQVLLLLST